MKVVSVINYKGGVGKTSLTANLSAELACRGYKVLIIDLDAQASLTFSFITPDDWRSGFESSGTIKAWFDSLDGGSPIELPSLVNRPPRVKPYLKSNNGVLEVIYSHLGLINVDLELATKLGGANLAQAKKNFISVHRSLVRGLEEFDEDSFDVVLIDCPPNFNIVTKTAIIASDYILVPTRPDALSTLGIDYLMRSVDGLIKDYNDFAAVQQGKDVLEINPKVLGVVFTMVQEYGGLPISAQRPFIRNVRNNSGLSVFESYIKRNDTLFADAPQYGVPVVLHGYSNVSHQSVVDGLEDVATEFIEAVGL